MEFLLRVPGAFLAPVIHEFIKARASSALGDPTPKKNGFNYNPFKYFEPIGFFLMLFFGVGWGQPAITSPFYYKNKKNGVLFVHVTPMFANLLIGMAAIFLMNFVTLPDTAALIIFHFGRLNIRLALFNLIPIAPMAMNKILQVFISPSAAMSLNNYEKPLQIVLFLLLMFNIVELVIHPISLIFMRAVMF
ncbi:MAG: site-2 protease family protein [Defluviitaleaceae bacterium]|nr:site-2 protease family protein [Defluviitaleaceae bacterium]